MALGNKSQKQLKKSPKKASKKFCSDFFFNISSWAFIYNAHAYYLLQTNIIRYVIYARMYFAST